MASRTYGHDRSLTNGDKSYPPRGYTSADELGSPVRRYGSRSGYSSGEDGRNTPTANGPSGYMSDSYRSPRSQSPATGNFYFVILILGASLAQYCFSLYMYTCYVCFV